MNSHTTPTQTPATPIHPEGGLPGWQISCDCGLVMASTIRYNVEADARTHAEWHRNEAARKARSERKARMADQGRREFPITPACAIGPVGGWSARHWCSTHQTYADPYRKVHEPR